MVKINERRVRQIVREAVETAAAVSSVQKQMSPSTYTRGTIRRALVFAKTESKMIDILDEAFTEVEQEIIDSGGPSDDAGPLSSSVIDEVAHQLQDMLSRRIGDWKTNNL